jgi:hypothetical protein
MGLQGTEDLPPEDLAELEEVMRLLIRQKRRARGLE